MPSLSAYNIIRIYSKLEDCETENKTRVDTRIRVRENGGSLDFNFISLLNSAVDENWVCCSSSSENDAAYDVPSYANFL